MLAQGGKLINFEEARRKRTADIYLPGDVDPEIKARPFSKEYYFRGKGVRYKGAPLRGGAVEAGRKLKLGRPIPGSTMQRFTGGTSLRQQGKARIMGRLQMIPSGHIPGWGPFPGGLRTLPQQPQFFPELAGFGQAPVGAANATGTTPVTRGFWGDLTSILTQAGTVILGTQTAKTQAQIAASQASIAASQAAAQQATVSGMVWKYLPLILAVGGGTVILYLMIQQRKKRG